MVIERSPRAILEASTAFQALASQLVALGLSSIEARAYLALLSSGRMPASRLCKETGIPDSKIYYALASLERKGLLQVQEGTPSLYEAVAPKQAIKSLKQQIEAEHRARTELADSLIERLTPLYERSSGGSIELAYVIRGRRNIIRKAKELIGVARREILVLASDESLLSSFFDELAMAKRKRVAIKGAVPDQLLTPNLPAFTQRKVLQCPCNLILVDNSTLLTVSDWDSENCYGILTKDANMVTMAHQYYNNPSCCS